MHREALQRVKVILAPVLDIAGEVMHAEKTGLRLGNGTLRTHRQRRGRAATKVGIFGFGRQRVGAAILFLAPGEISASLNW